MAAPLRGPRALAALASSYVLRRPRDAIAGAPRALRFALVPAGAAWSAALAAGGAIAALRVGVRVRRAPILRARPALLAHGDELAPAFALVSDTHVALPGALPCELVADPAQWPFAEPPAIATALDRVLRHVARHAPRTVVWCGDTVDTGDSREWRAWQAVVDAVPELAHRLVPGNHDICFNRPFDADYALARRALRERAFHQHASALADFPIVDTIVTTAGAVTLVLLDSCQHRSRHVLSNAIGRFGDVQLGELARVLAATRGPVACVMHHHPWRDARFLAPETWYETAVDADRLVAILAAYRARAATNAVLVCHGHRHIMTAGEIGDGIAVLGMPSTTLGDKSARDVLDGVARYAVAGLRRDGTWGIVVRAVQARREHVARAPANRDRLVTEARDGGSEEES